MSGSPETLDGSDVADVVGKEGGGSGEGGHCHRGAGVLEGVMHQLLQHSVILLRFDVMPH